MYKAIIVFGIILLLYLIVIVVVLVKYKLVNKLTIKLNFFQLFKFEIEIEKTDNTET
ncbi:MAG: hypothetical protein IJC13_03960 [Clostridia bacterium]|nr:hypothetical protein [Clostridia bacterium]